MQIVVEPDARSLGRAAGTAAAKLIREAIRQQGAARVIVATGASQFATLETLTSAEGIDWPRVTGFHLDEYLGLPAAHPASFRGYLRERFVERVQPAAFHYIDGEAADAGAECDRLAALIEQAPIDLALVGIGENGHLAFNDPPADFETERAYHVVELDDACRRQQLGEGWFDSFEEVPARAISMTIHRILQSAAIICSVPDRRKAAAVRDCLSGPVDPRQPASILQRHPRTTVYLDRAAASLLP